MNLKNKPTTTKLQLQLLSFCLLCLTGKTLCDGNDPAVVKVEQDRDVILPCSLSTKENIELNLFDWKKAAQKDDGQKEVFFYDAGIHYNNGRSGQSEEFKGRVFHFTEELKHGNASIIIRNTKVTDSGNYTCVFPRLQQPQTFHIKLVVGAAPKPSLIAHVQRKDRVLLQCVVQGASPKPKLEWQDSSGNKLPAEEPQVTDRGGSYDITLNTNVTKTDHYRCVVTQEEISHQTDAQIYVPVIGAVKKPSVTVLQETKDWALLQCVVRGASPKPKVEWKDSSGNKLPAEEPQVTDRGGSYDIILQTTVTKTDYYHCVVTQEEISHHSEIHVFIYVPDSPTGLTVAVVLLALVVLILAAVVFKCHIPLKRKKGSATVKQEGSAVPLNSKLSRSQEAPDPET